MVIVLTYINSYVDSSDQKNPIKYYADKLTEQVNDVFFKRNILGFPSNQFNHAICCVPLQKDTVWLECTSQTLVAGYLGDFTCDRKALLLTEKGGVVVKTPTYTKEDNVQVRKIDAVIDETGSVNARIITRYSGLEQDALHFFMHNETREQQQKSLRSKFPLTSYDVKDFSYKETRTVVPSIEEALTITIDNYANISGRRLFVLPNMLSASNVKLLDTYEKNFHIKHNYSFTNIDTVSLRIPSGYVVETLPHFEDIDNKFGKYSIRFSFETDKIICIRRYERNKNTFSKSEYKDFVKFYDTIYKADHTKVVLIKNN